MKTQVAFYVSEIRNVANKGFFHLFTAQGFVLLAGFLSQFFVAGFLDPTDIGRIKIMQTYLSLFALISGLGFDYSLLKLASEKRTPEEKRKLYQSAFVVTTIAFIGIYIILYMSAVSGLVSTDHVLSNLFPMYMLFLLPTAIQSIQLAFYQAEKRVKRLAKLHVICKSVSIAFIVAGTFWFKLPGYILSVVATGFITIAILETGIQSFKTSTGFFKLDIGSLKSMWRMAGYALITNMFGLLSHTIDIYLINYLVSDREEVGFYMFALTIISVLQIFPTTIQQTSFPFFSEQSASYSKWYSSYLKYNKLNHLLILGVVVAAILSVPFLIKIVFAGKYDRSIHYFVFLSIAWMIKFSNIIKSTAIMGYGRFDICFKAATISLCLTLPVVFFCIYNYGLNGALVGVTAGSVISYLVYTVAFRRFNLSLQQIGNPTKYAGV